MNGKAIEWVVWAVVALGLGAASLALGMTLLPSGAAAQERGTLIPWLLTWGMIWMTAIIAVSLAGFLVVTGMNQSKSQV